MSIIGTGQGSGGGGAAVGDVVRTEIERITNATAGEFDFTVPTGYDRLIIRGQLRSDVAGDFEAAHIYFNADTTAANYHSQASTGLDNAGAHSELNEPRLFGICAAGAPTDTYATVSCEIERPDNSFLKTALGTFSAYRASDKAWTGDHMVTSAITDPLTRIRIRTDNHATDQLFGTLILYGEKTQT